MKSINNQNTINLFFIFIFNIIFHFIPFERSIISPDTFSFFSNEKLGILNFLYNPDRPIEFIIHELEYYFLNYNFNYHFYYLIFSTIFLNVIIYFFFENFFKKDQSLLLSLLFSILPFKIEIYHSSIYAWINIIESIYILSILLFIKYTKNKVNLFYIISIFLFFISVLGRESGIFLPIALFIFIILFIKPINIFSSFILIIPYISIILFSFILRITGGFFHTDNMGRNIDIQNIPSGFYDIFNIFLGRYLFKNIIYGLYQFINIPYFLILIFLLINILIIILFSFKYLKLNSLKIDFNKKIFMFFLSIFILSLIPNLIAGSIGGRNTIIASLFISLVFLYLIKYLNKYISIIIIFITIIINQGNAYTHVLSLRLASSVYSYLDANQKILNNYDNIVIDTNDFSKNIEFTLVTNKYNVLNTYYGAQTFEDWGLDAMVNLNLDQKNTYISSGGIKKTDTFHKILIYQKIGYNKFTEKEILLPVDNTFIINYEKVFKNNLEKR